jgi:hypothetical protein
MKRAQTAPPQRRKAAQEEAEWHQKPWLERNLPVTPPPHAAVSETAPTAKKASYSLEDLAASGASSHRHVTSKMDVLSLKVGYALDAEYALPDEV